MLRRTAARFAARSAPRRAGGAEDGSRWNIPSKDYLKSAHRHKGKRFGCFEYMWSFG